MIDQEVFENIIHCVINYFKYYSVKAYGTGSYSILSTNKKGNKWANKNIMPSQFFQSYKLRFFQSPVRK